MRVETFVKSSSLGALCLLPWSLLPYLLNATVNFVHPEAREEVGDRSSRCTLKLVSGDMM
ncbi:MAG: hypothetical protein F6K14_14710 [Symploca sp. SIO2C1]|nr:hypothetical protein [Symploca sp. SIO2C1]